MNIIIDANGIILSPAILQRAVYECQKRGREPLEFQIASEEMNNVGVATLYGLPLVGVEMDRGIIAIADQQGVIGVISNIPYPILDTFIFEHAVAISCPS